MMKNAQIIAEFGRKIGLPHLALDKDNACDIVIADTAEITFTGDPAGTELRLTALIADLPGREAVLPKLLEANAVAAQTGGAAFAVDAWTAEIVLVRQIEVDHLTVDGFAERVEAFAAMALVWIEHLPELAHGADGETGEVTQIAGSDAVLMRI